MTIKSIDTNPQDFDWNHYFQLDTINKWLDFIASEHDFITTINLGESVNGETVKGIKFAKKSDNPTIFIEAGIHAREWISPATATFLINQLIHSESKL